MVYRKLLLLLHCKTDRKGRSPVGLERCSHIAEVIGSSPIVPTSIFKMNPYSELRFREGFFLVCIIRYTSTSFVSAMASPDVVPAGHFVHFILKKTLFVFSEIEKPFGLLCFLYTHFSLSVFVVKPKRWSRFCFLGFPFGLSQLPVWA